MAAPAETRRNTRLYLTGLTASLVGDSIMSLVAGIWVKTLTGSSGAAALVSVCIYAPSLLGPLGGVIADRFRRRRLILAVNVGMALAVLALLAVRSRDQVWLIYVVMTVYGASIVLVDAAEAALFAIMLPTKERQRVNGLRLSIQESGKLVAPLLGAGLFAAFSGGLVAVVDAVTFGVAAVVTAALRVTEPAPSAPSSDWLSEVGTGVRHVHSIRALRVVVIAAAVAMFVSGLVVAAQFSLVDRVGQRPSFLGVLVALLGAGSVLAGLATSGLLRRMSELDLGLLGLANGVIGNLLLATGVLPCALIGSFVRGFALPWTVIAVISLSQRLTPSDRQGRVSAAISFALFAPQPVAQLLGAGAIHLVDFRWLYVTVAGSGALLVGWLSSARRSINAEIIELSRGDEA